MAKGSPLDTYLSGRERVLGDGPRPAPADCEHLRLYSSLHARDHRIDYLERRIADLEDLLGIVA